MRVFLVLAFFAIIAPSFALDWSFKAHPHPLFDELTQNEHDAIFAAIRDESERECAKNAEETDFFFCGKFSRPPESAKEEEIATLIREIFGYIQTDEPGRANKFLSYNAIGPIIELHPDIEYYYRARFTPPDYIDKKKVMRQTVHPNHTFSPARKTELNQAIEAGDVQRVIDTMGDRTSAHCDEGET